MRPLKAKTYISLGLTSLVVTVLLVVALLVVPIGATSAQPAFVDVTVARNIDFVGSYGPTFDGLSASVLANGNAELSDALLNASEAVRGCIQRPEPAPGHAPRDRRRGCTRAPARTRAARDRG